MESRLLVPLSVGDLPEELCPDNVELPLTLGPYELVERLGRGGMGTVYLAQHTRLKRPAAIKVVRADRLAHRNSIARFLREMEAVGRLDHPNLVRAYDAGQVGGRYFLAMELVVGADLHQLVGQLGPLRVPDACEVVRQAARGLQYAHQHGLVHRDVKPSNLIVASDGTVKLLDLGLARLAGSNEESGNTATDQILGSGDYLAPEQAEDSRQADAQSDLYALGCVLYFLLAGRAPFDDVRHNTFGRKLLAHATEDVPEITRLRADLPTGLADLLSRMLAKRPADRPDSMAEIERAMAEWTEGSDLPARIAKLPEPQCSVSRDVAERDTPASCQRGETDPNRVSFPPAKSEATTGRLRRRWPKVLTGALGALLIAMAFALPRSPTETRTSKPLNPSALVQEPSPLPGSHGWTLETRGGRATVTHLALSPDERMLAAADATGSVRILQTATSDLVRILVEREPIHGIAWLPHGGELAVAAGSLRLWDAETGNLLWQAPLSEAQATTSVECGPEGMLASGHRNGEIRLWNTGMRELAKVLPGHATAVTALRFSADGARLASGEEGRTIRVWRMPGGSPLHRFADAEPGPIRRLAWSPDATRLASCGGGRHVTVWDQTQEFRPRKEDAASQPVGDLGWSPDGEEFFSVSGGEQGMEFAVLWDGEVRQQIRKPLMAPNAATAMVWSGDGKTIYCGLRGGELRTYLPDANRNAVFRQAATMRTTASAWAPDASLLLLGDCAGWSRLWCTAEARQMLAVRTSKHPVWVLAWHPAGERFAAGHTDGKLVTVDAATGSVHHQVSCNGHIFDVAFSPDGRWLATAEEHGMCRLWDAASGDERCQFPLKNGHVVNAVAWSVDGRYLAFSAWDARVRTIDVEQRKVVAEWDSEQGFVWRMQWEPEGHILLTSGKHGGVGYWDARSGALLRREDGCLLERGLVSNRLGMLRGSCASGVLRGISPDGAQNVHRLDGDLWGIRNLDTKAIRLALVPMMGGNWMAIDRERGYYRAELSAMETLVHVIATGKGQENCTPAEFAARYGWENVPDKIGQ